MTVEQALDSPYGGGPRTAAQTKKTVQQEVLV